MLRFVKGALRRLSTKQDAQAPKRIAGLRCWDIWFAGSLQGKNQANQFLGSMRDSDVVVFALRALFSEVSSKGTIPMANVPCGIEESIAKVTGTPLFNMSIGVIQLA